MSPSTSPSSAHTNLTTPDQSPGTHSDIWAADDSPSPTHPTDTTRRQDELLSDLPSIKRQHMTAGYREGLSVGKARVIQSGFDAGYPIGVEIALRVGRVLGVLEGVLSAQNSGEGGKLGHGKGDARRDEVRVTCERATRELDVKVLLSGVNDEVVAEARGVPPDIEAVLRRWESVVLAELDAS